MAESEHWRIKRLEKINESDRRKIQRQKKLILEQKFEIAELHRRFEHLRNKSYEYSNGVFYTAYLQEELSMLEHNYDQLNQNYSLLNQELNRYKRLVHDDSLSTDG